MESIRKPLQGISNIIRFNWHFYLLAVVFVLFLFLLKKMLPGNYHFAVNSIVALTLITTLASLLTSFYVYDLSGLYKLNWLNDFIIERGSTVVNINAGFDETSALIQQKFPAAIFKVFDFYDPLKHTEVSIKRARKAYPAFSGTESITTAHLPLQDKEASIICLVLAAHEIRVESERNGFFKELKRTLADDGYIVVTEHLRDLPNFLAYNIGFFHFMPKDAWYRSFTNTGLIVSKEIKHTPFITTFILKKHGTTA